MKPSPSVLIRSTSGGFEPRFKWAEKFLLGFSNSIRPIIWSRTVKDSTFVKSDSTDVFRFQAAYGQGIKNLFSHFLFFLFVLRRLRVINPKLIYACDLDALLPSLIWRMNRKTIVVFDQFDPLSSRVNNQFLGLLIGKLEIYLADKSDIKITANRLRIPENTREDWFELKNAFGFDIQLKTLEEEKPPFILFYGGILAHDRGLLGCADAVSQESDWEFHLYGQGAASNLLKTGRYRNVFVHEPVPHEELMQSARKSDLFLAMYAPTRSHNRLTASNKLFEAAQLGIPLLTSKNTFLGELVEGLGLGWSIAYDDTSEISRILTEYKTLDRTKKLYTQKSLQDFFESELLHKQETIDRLSREIAKKLEA